MGSSIGDYEVFLSFRGADTRQGLTDILYEYMSNAKIRVFRDDNTLRIGDKIDSIFKAIVYSKICIPIFSPNFVQSKYCMLEVTKMVELKKTIVPIFCNVTSDDVKLKTPLYVNDFKKLEKKYGKLEVGKWKEALKEAVSYKGRKVGDKGYCEFCKEFVDEVLSKLRLTAEVEIDHSDGEATNVESLDIGSSSQEAVSDGTSDGIGGIAIATEAAPIAMFGAPVVVLGQEFVVPYPMDFIFRNMGRRRFDVTNSDGAILFKVNGHLSTFNSELLDASGNTLFTLYQKRYMWVFNLHVFRGKSTSKKDFLFTVKFTKVLQKVTNFIIPVYVGKKPKEDVWDYRIEGSWPEKNCLIYAGNTDVVVAQVMDKSGTVQSAKGKDCLGVTVYPNMDYAFIVGVVVFLTAAFEPPSYS